MRALARILVLNCGSSSLKYALFDMLAGQLLVSGLVERIGESIGGHIQRRWQADGEAVKNVEELVVADHGAALDHVFTRLLLETDQPLDAIGHRVVHGGATFRQPTRLSEESMAQIRETIPLAPLHNPINLAGIQAAMTRYPDLPQVAVFDTAFHQTMPEVAWRYAVPREWHARWGVRRYGFHGTSHGFVAAQAALLLNKPLDQCNLITLHLGNGASIAAIRAGQCVDTSMGLTPLEGLVMGTRCGDLDPAIPAYMERVAKLEPAQVDAVLNSQSGLKALCGDYDMRSILNRVEAGEPDAQAALELYCYRIRKYLGAYTAVLGQVDALVFTGGIGEHAAPVRERVCQALDVLGIRLDQSANLLAGGKARAIQAQEGTVAIFVIPTNEELEIARQTVVCLSGPTEV